MLLCFLVFMLWHTTTQSNSKCQIIHNYIKYGLKEYLLIQNSLFLRLNDNFKHYLKYPSSLADLSNSRNIKNVRSYGNSKLLCHNVSNTDFISSELDNWKTPNSLNISSFELPISSLFKYPSYTNAPLQTIEHLRKLPLEIIRDLKNLYFGCFCAASFLQIGRVFLFVCCFYNACMLELNTNAWNH